MREGECICKAKYQKGIGNRSSKQAIPFCCVLPYKRNPESETIELEAAMNIYHRVLYVHTVITARGKNIFLYN